MSNVRKVVALLELLDGLDDAQREEFAKQVSDARYGKVRPINHRRGTSYAYLRLIALGHSRASPPLAKVIEEVAARFGRPVSRAELRPDVFGAPPSMQLASAVAP